MDQNQVQIVLQLALATILGGIVGLEREYKRKEAGLQTYSLVALGSCLFTIIGLELFNVFSGQAGVTYDHSRIILAVATGIGFIGAGVIMHRDVHIQGLTTAAGLWLGAAIGVAVGVELYFLAIASTILAIFILVVFGRLENRFFGNK